MALKKLVAKRARKATAGEGSSAPYKQKLSSIGTASEVRSISVVLR